MRILSSILLLLVGFVASMFYVQASEPGLVFGELWLAQTVSYTTFFLGVFHLLPQMWRWFKRQETLRRIARWVWGSISALSGLAGLALVCLSVLPLRPEGAELTWWSALVWLMLGSLMMSAAGVQLHALSKAVEQERLPREAARRVAVNIVLKLARSHGGRLTALEVASDSMLSVDQAREQLERFAEEGLCEPCVSEVGSIFYRFHEFENPRAKRDILDGYDDGEVYLDLDASQERRSRRKKREEVAEVAEAKRRN